MSNMAYSRHILITGPPGCGKTTAVRKLCQILKSDDVPVTGFYTEERRQNGARCGFDVVSLSTGERNSLARLSRDSSWTQGPRVGRYVVEVSSFEAVVKPFFDNVTDTSGVLVIDEIGKMELFSEYFKTRVKGLFDVGGGYIVVATVPVKRHGMPLVEKLCEANTSTLVTVDYGNRNDLPNQISQQIIGMYRKTEN